MIVSPGHAYCRRCGKVKPVEEFHKKHGTPQKRGTCMVCYRKQRAGVYRKRLKDDPRKLREACMLASARARAKEAGRECTITAVDVHIPRACPSCKSHFDIPRAVRSGSGPLRKSPSLDRFDNTFGYIPGNVVVICHSCNTAKGDRTAAELRSIADWMDKKENRGVSAHHRSALGD